MQRETDQSRIILDILESVDRDGGHSQRRRASEVGIALGLINAYLKFCIRKGYLKARKISARSYQYALTPKGFAEKSRLAMSRLSDSLAFVRATRGEFAAAVEEAKKHQWQGIVIVGSPMLAEICALCALERGVTIVAIVDPHAKSERVLGIPVHRDFAAITEPFSGAVVAELQNPAAALEIAEAALGESRVLIPNFLRVILPKRGAV
jgi:predicted transcriptional regulator